MRVVAATGPVEARSEAHRLWVRLALLSIGEADEYVGGAAYGIDTLWSEEAAEQFPDARHTLVVPIDCWHNEELVQRFFQLNHTIIEVPGKKPTGYMKRNDILAMRCSHLAAFPESPHELIRSGTWSTIRRARRLQRIVRMFPLSEMV